MNLKHHIRRLKKHQGEVAGAEEERILHKALTRMTTEDLRLGRTFLDRLVEEGAKLTEEEAEALALLGALCEEVRQEGLQPRS